MTCDAVMTFPARMSSASMSACWIIICFNGQSVAADQSSYLVESIVHRYVPVSSAYVACMPAGHICWPVDIDDCAAMYDRELTSHLHHLVTFCPITVRPRPSDPWFDHESRDAKCC